MATRKNIPNDNGDDEESKGRTLDDILKSGGLSESPIYPESMKKPPKMGVPMADLFNEYIKDAVSKVEEIELKVFKQKSPMGNMYHILFDRQYPPLQLYEKEARSLFLQLASELTK